MPNSGPAYAHAAMSMRPHERADACRCSPSRPAHDLREWALPLARSSARRTADPLLTSRTAKPRCAAPIALVCRATARPARPGSSSADGVLHESRVSYFTKIDGLAFTMGAPPGTPSSLAEAMGRPMDKSDTPRVLRLPHHVLGSRG